MEKRLQKTTECHRLYKEEIKQRFRNVLSNLGLNNTEGVADERKGGCVQEGGGKLGHHLASASRMIYTPQGKTRK